MRLEILLILVTVQLVNTQADEQGSCSAIQGECTLDGEEVLILDRATLHATMPPEPEKSETKATNSPPLDQSLPESELKRM